MILFGAQFITYRIVTTSDTIIDTVVLQLNQTVMVLQINNNCEARVYKYKICLSLGFKFDYFNNPIIINYK